MRRIFSPTRRGQFIISPPEGAGMPTAGGIPLILGGRGAFGSGEHETTAACLELLPLVPALQSRTVLDLGCGTGILAIAAARLGAPLVIAIDLSWEAAVSCRENVDLNGVTSRVQTICGTLDAVRLSGLGLIMANIYADILYPLADQLVHALQPGGYILLSGIPLQDKFDIWRRYTNLGCTDVDSRIGEEFATYLFRRETA